MRLKEEIHVLDRDDDNDDRDDNNDGDGTS